MDVKTSGLIYKFQEDSLFSEASTPYNLCPYMRRFIRLFVGTTLCYTALIIAAVGVVAAPLYAIFGSSYDVLGWYFKIYTSLGWGAWLIVTGGAIFWVLNRVFSNKYKSRRAMNRVARTYIKEPVVRAVKRNVFIQWYKAVHDKICPTLHFVDPNAPAETEEAS